MQRVVIVDDQMLIRVGMASILGMLGGYEVVGQASSGRDAIPLIDETKPDIVLLDVDMEDDGIETAARLREGLPGLRVILVSGIDEPETVLRALRCGADGYIHKDFVLEELAEGLTCIRDGIRYVSPKINKALLNYMASPATQRPALTPRQTQILRLVAMGLTGKAIARKLDISPKTVEFHRAELMKRLQLHDIASLTRYAVSIGLIEDEPTSSAAGTE